MADVRILDELVLEAGAFYVMDRGYLDFFRLYNFVLTGAFFVTRSKARVQFIRLEVRPVNPATGVRSDHLVRLRHESSLKDYPAKLRTQVPEPARRSMSPSCCKSSSARAMVGRETPNCLTSCGSLGSRLSTP